jgi:DAACS family dicarboxylate/amino acid:cation (Na+ or H+) symporter
LKKIALHWKILVGMILGIVAGIIVRQFGLSAYQIDQITTWVKPIGDIFLRMIFMMVIPLILSALALGVAGLGNVHKLGRIGLKMIGYTVIVSSISVLIGITAVKLFEPGKGLSVEDRTYLTERYTENKDVQKITAAAGEARQRTVGDILTVLVPKNPVEDMAHAFDPNYTGGGLLAVMFFALVMGIALSATDPEKVSVFRGFLEGLYEVVMKVIGYGMKLAPVGVAALLFVVTVNLGFSILKVLGLYVIVVLSALLIHQFITYSILLKIFTRIAPGRFFGHLGEVIVTAFSTSSSNVTLPTAIRTANDKLKLPKDISNFVLTIGSTANQNGTALYEGITVLFLAQCFGVHLDIGEQILVVLLCILGGVGTAGVPGGSLPVVMLILISIGIPGESIALIYGVDRILDMSRTVVNVTGDLTAAAVIAGSERQNSQL